MTICYDVTVNNVLFAILAIILTVVLIKLYRHLLVIEVGRISEGTDVRVTRHFIFRIGDTRYKTNNFGHNGVRIDEMFGEYPVDDKTEERLRILIKRLGKKDSARFSRIFSGGSYSDYI